MQETWVRFLGWEDSLEEGMATHSSTPAWRVPWTEEPGGLQSTGSQRVGHDRATKQQTVIDLTQINESFGSLVTFKMVLFIYWLCSGSSLLHGLFSSCSGFSSPWLPLLQSTGSRVEAHRLSCSVACGIFLGQRSNLCLLHWQADSLPLSHQGSPGL